MGYSDWNKKTLAPFSGLRHSRAGLQESALDARSSSAARKRDFRSDIPNEYHKFRLMPRFCLALIAIAVVQAVFRCGSHVLAGLDPAIHAFNASKWRERFARTKSLVPPSLCFTAGALSERAQRGWPGQARPGRPERRDPTAQPQSTAIATSASNYLQKIRK